jgi:hypothetical protein
MNVLAAGVLVIEGGIVVVRGELVVMVGRSRGLKSEVSSTGLPFSALYLVG